jgi:hypothetical protein
MPMTSIRERRSPYETMSALKQNKTDLRIKFVHRNYSITFLMLLKFLLTGKSICDDESHEIPFIWDILNALQCVKQDVNLQLEKSQELNSVIHYN